MTNIDNPMGMHNVYAIAGIIPETTMAGVKVPLCMGCLMVANKDESVDFFEALELVHVPINATCSGCGKPFMSEESIDALIRAKMLILASAPVDLT